MYLLKHSKPSAVNRLLPLAVTPGAGCARHCFVHCFVVSMFMSHNHKWQRIGRENRDKEENGVNEGKERKERKGKLDG